MAFKKMMLNGFLFSLGSSVVGYLLIYSMPEEDRALFSTNKPSYVSYQAQAASQQLMEQARMAYNLQDYKIVNDTLSKLLKQYPGTEYTEEASCLLAKGLYYENKLDESKAVITRLQEHNPKLRSQCMGDVLLILGRIYQKEGQIDSAVHVYRKVINQFSSYESLVNQAEDMLFSISL